MSNQPRPKQYSSSQTIIFMVVLSVICAVILSVLASALAEPKELAKDLDRSKQMMIAAKLFDANGYFITQDKEGNIVPAKYDNGLLIPSEKPVFATSQEILDIYQRRLLPFLTNNRGEIKTFKELGIDENKYLNDYRKSGYYKEPWKLFYKIMPNDDSNKAPAGYVIPVNGYGLWDAIYGYIAIAPDADTVIGISWYDQKETPGLGANITESPWQDLFPGKKIFLESPNGSTDFQSAPLGITVVKGKVSEVLGDSPKSKSAVDGMAGATLTGNGVTDAYKNVLSSYRPLFLKLQAEEKK